MELELDRTHRNFASSRERGNLGGITIKNIWYLSNFEIALVDGVLDDSLSPIFGRYGTHALAALSSLLSFLSLISSPSFSFSLSLSLSHSPFCRRREAGTIGERNTYPLSHAPQFLTLTIKTFHDQYKRFFRCQIKSHGWSIFRFLCPQEIYGSVRNFSSVLSRGKEFHL